MRGVDADFAVYVRAREHQLLRAAYLVCGDGQRAEELLLHAPEELALRWDTTRDGDPDAYVRRVLYRALDRDAMSQRRTGRGQLTVVPERSVPAGDVAAQLRVEVERALRQLSP